MGSTPVSPATWKSQIAGWSSLVARQAHNLKVVGSNPAPATNFDLACRRTVAQPGSAFAWGAKGHEFKSRRSDHFFPDGAFIRFGSFAPGREMWYNREDMGTVEGAWWRPLRLPRLVNGELHEQNHICFAADPRAVRRRRLQDGRLGPLPPRLPQGRCPPRRAQRKQRNAPSLREARNAGREGCRVTGLPFVEAPDLDVAVPQSGGCRKRRGIRWSRNQ